MNEQSFIKAKAQLFETPLGFADWLVSSIDQAEGQPFSDAISQWMHLHGTTCVFDDKWVWLESGEQSISFRPPEWLELLADIAGSKSFRPLAALHFIITNCRWEGTK